MADVEVKPTGQVADAAKVLSNGDNIPKILDGGIDPAKELSAPPSTPNKEDEEVLTEEVIPEKDVAEKVISSEEVGTKQPKKSKSDAYPHFPRFRVTWDSTKPSLMSLKSPGKKKRRGSQSAMAERSSVLMAQEMTPQAALVEFIATSASYHGVRRQTLTELEDDLFRVFRNNVMPANAAAWYMAKRRFFTKTPGSNQNPLLPTLLKEYPKKFALKNNVVIFLETYSPNVARMKLKYLVEQGMYSYFSHKVDECGVHFFDPLYYEETEPFHANLRMVTNIYNNQRIKLVPSYFKKFRKQFQYKHISPYLVAISKVETEIVTGVTGIVVAMFDKKYGLIKFNRNTETCLALFTTSALYQNGFRITADPKTLPPIFFDAYKIPENERSDKFKWFAVLTWVGRRPNPKFGATKADLMACPQYKASMVPRVIEQINAKKNEEAVDYMKMGLVKEIRKNGAIAYVKEDGEAKEQKFFIPGWAYTHANAPKVKLLTTTQGIGLNIGDLVNFYIDANMTAVPYDAVACYVDVLKHTDVPKAPIKKKHQMGSPAKKGRPRKGLGYQKPGQPEGWVTKDNSHKVTTTMKPLPKVQIVPPMSTTYPEASMDGDELKMLENNVRVMTAELNKICKRFKIKNLNKDDLSQYPEKAQEKLKIASTCLGNAEETLNDFKDFLKTDKYKEWNEQQEDKYSIADEEGDEDEEEEAE